MKLSSATYLINILPSKVINFSTPVERLLGETPDYNSLRVFGYACWPNLRPYTIKLSFRSIRCVFLGYSSMHKGFKCLDPSTGRVYISRDVVFDENIFPFAQLHPNACTRLRKEILLPDHLSNPRDVTLVGQTFANINPSSSEPCVQEIADLHQADAEDPDVGSHGDSLTGSGTNPDVDLPLPPVGTVTFPDSSGSSPCATHGGEGRGDNTALSAPTRASATAS